MNASADLSQLAEGLERLRADATTPAACAKATGHAISTISRDRATKQLIDWPWRDGLLIARAVPEINTALIAFHNGRALDLGSKDKVAEDLVAEVEASNDVALRIRSGLADNELRVQEIDAIVAAVKKRQAADACLISDMRALRRTARP